MAYTVLGGNVSPFVRKVRVFLIEKEIDYELEPVNPFAPPEGFRKISPLGLIPAFRHDEQIVNDSTVICRYIERLHPEPALIPGDPALEAQALWIETYISDLTRVSGPGIFRNLVLNPLMTGGEPDEAAAQKVIDDELPKYYDYLEEMLGDNEFFVDGRFSIADIAVASSFVNLRHAGVAPDAVRWPRFAAFVKRMHARPSFAALIAEESPVFGKRAALLEA